MSDILQVARIDEDTLELVLNRPWCRNALSQALVAELTAALARADADQTVRSVILTGAPPAFCAGLDLREVAESVRTHERHDASAVVNLLELIAGLSKPVIAAVNGAAVAGGAGLVSVCDVAVCAQSAVLGYPEIKRGLVATIVMTHLWRAVGQRHARYLLLTGESVSARQAFEMGLVNEVVPDDQLQSRARHYATLFAALPRETLAQTKAAFNRLVHLMDSEALAEARQYHRSVPLTAESRAGLAGFLTPPPGPT